MNLMGKSNTYSFVAEVHLEVKKRQSHIPLISTASSRGSNYLNIPVKKTFI